MNRKTSTGTLVALMGLGAALAAACTATVAIDGRPCPCAAGYVCCATTNQCLAQGETCGGADAAADAVGDGQLPPPHVDGGGIPDSPPDTLIAADVMTCNPVTAPPPDGGITCTAPDASSSSTDGGAACVPHASVTVPDTWTPPAPAHQGKCTSAQITEFRTACLGATSDQTACNTFMADPAGKACASCILSKDTDTAYGPLIEHPSQGTVELNIYGCVAAVEPCNATCAKALARASTCGALACADCGPITDQASLDAYDKCTAEASGCACASETQDATCGDRLVGPAHPASACLAGKTFDDSYDAIVPLFCGP